MFISRYIYSQLKNNSHFILGLCIGFVLAFNFPDLNNQSPCEDQLHDVESFPSPIKGSDDYEPKFNLQNKPGLSPKALKPIQRPRYYSTELGIREKLFIGVLTTEHNINFQASAINKTLAHLANKIKFFITANVVKNNLSLANVVGFTDTREILKPFHVLKYISDNYLEEFDYFYLISDVAYVNGRKLMEIVNGISVSEDVYMGTITEEDSHYCSLDAGMLLSNSVMKRVKENLDWCVRNSYSRELYENIGRCITHSTSLRCRQSIQDRHLTSFRLPKDWDLKRDLKSTIDNNESFIHAVTVYPVTEFTDFYTLQLYFAKYHLETVQSEILSLSHTVRMAGGPWPPGGREDPTVPSPPPPDRFDQPVYTAVTLNSSYMSNFFHNTLPHTEVEERDVKYVVNAATLKVRNENTNLIFHSLVNAYRRFDQSRGMNYILDINFVDTSFDNNGDKKIVLKRLEVFKPLGKATMLPVPYVTENTRVSMIMPIWEYQTSVAMEFLRHYEVVCMQRKDKMFLLLVLMYSADAPSKGTDDPFNEIKMTSLDLSQKYRVDNSKISWLSIRLPVASFFGHTHPPKGSATNGGLISVAIADLALKKLPPDSLVLVGRPHMEIKPDFSNRIRMNTISGYQVFSAMGFQSYHPSLSTGPVPSKGAGRFAPWDYSVTSFYIRDYVAVRKSIVNKYPIVRSDKDIEVLFANAEDDVVTLFELFVKYGEDLHAFRGVEPGLSFKYDETMFCPPDTQFKNISTVGQSYDKPNVENSVPFGKTVLYEKCLNTLSNDEFISVTIGSRSQLAKLIFESNL